MSSWRTPPSSQRTPPLYQLNIYQGGEAYLSALPDNALSVLYQCISGLREAVAAGVSSEAGGGGGEGGNGFIVSDGGGGDGGGSEGGGGDGSGGDVGTYACNL